jgi:hypothetical protein
VCEDLWGCVERGGKCGCMNVPVSSDLGQASLPAEKRKNGMESIIFDQLIPSWRSRIIIGRY